jgi:hypothetical protein
MRYRAANGRFVSSQQVHGYVVDYSTNVGKALRTLTEQLRVGQVTLAEWQLAMAGEIKAAHLAAGMAAAGGKAQMTQATYGAIGQRLRQEYQYLQKFADGIANGIISLDGRILQRAEQYGRDARETYQRIMQREAARRGYDEERRFLHGNEHCPECVEYAARAWQPIGTLPPPGDQSSCRANCLCTKSFRNSVTGQVFG